MDTVLDADFYYGMIEFIGLTPNGLMCAIMDTVVYAGFYYGMIEFIGLTPNVQLWTRWSMLVFIMGWFSL